MSLSLPADVGEYAREALLITDAARAAGQARIVWANAAAVALTGRSHKELIASPAGTFFAPVADPSDCAALDAALAQGEPFHGRLAALRADGSEIRVDLSVEPITENGEARWWRWSQRDVTAECALEASRLKLLERLESTSLRNAMLLAKAHEALAAKAGFMASVSHELRTPLNGVLGMARLLQKTELTARQARMASAIEHAGRHLFFLISDVLEFSRASDAPLEIIRAPLDIGVLARDMATHFEPEADEKGIALTARVTANDPVVLATDGVRLRQILFNLISNAVKYTEQGRIDITVSRAGADAVIDVVDTGIGIEPEFQQRIFEEYVRTPNGRASGAGGVGIGLSVTVKLAETIGAALNFCSSPGAGTHFRVRLRTDAWGET